MLNLFSAILARPSRSSATSGLTLVPTLRVRGASRLIGIALGHLFATRPRSIVALPRCVTTQLAVLARLLVGLLAALVALVGLLPMRRLVLPLNACRLLSGTRILILLAPPLSFFMAGLHRLLSPTTRAVSRCSGAASSLAPRAPRWQLTATSSSRVKRLPKRLVGATPRLRVLVAPSPGPLLLAAIRVRVRVRVALTMKSSVRGRAVLTLLRSRWMKMARTMLTMARTLLGIAMGQTRPLGAASSGRDFEYRTWTCRLKRSRDCGLCT
jgi:hypothetical protein